MEVDEVRTPEWENVHSTTALTSSCSLKYSIFSVALCFSLPPVDAKAQAAALAVENKPKYKRSA